MHVLPKLLNPSSDAILKKMMDLPSFIISGRNLNTTIYVYDIVLMVESKSKLQDLISKSVRRKREKKKY